MVLAQELAHGPIDSERRHQTTGVHRGQRRDGRSGRGHGRDSATDHELRRLPHRGRVVPGERPRHGRVPGSVAAMSLPLDGIRVVDFSRVLAGPHCAKTLLDLGAEVIKLEPPGGDLSRRAFPAQGRDLGLLRAAERGQAKREHRPERAWRPRGCAAPVRDRATWSWRTSDQVRSPPSDWTTVSRRRETRGVVYASISGYGQHGPWRSRMAYAPTVQAETGITANTADHFGRARHLRSDSLSHADVYSGLHAAIAILACLAERERTGKGQYVDVAMAARDALGQRASARRPLRRGAR